MRKRNKTPMGANAIFTLKAPSPYASADVIIIESVTHLHVGSGKVSGEADLPVQRDEYGYPCIYSSSLKGALKSALSYAAAKALKDKNQEKWKILVQALMGPDPEPEESFESSIALLDARLLAMPVRSLKGVYAYVTTPTLLRRFSEYLELAINVRNLQVEEKSEGQKTTGEGRTEGSSSLEKIKEAVEKMLEEEPSESTFYCFESKQGLCKKVQIEEIEGQVVLAEDFMLSHAQKQGGGSLNYGTILETLGITERPLLILEDTVGEEVINRSLLALAHVRLKRETKTVEEGPWTTEYVPAKAKFFTLALYKRPYLTQKALSSLLGDRAKESSEKENYLKALKELGFDEKYLSDGNYAEACREKFRNLIKVLNNYIIVGGRETVGKGIIKVKFLDGERP
jgi:CRISPR-associated protein Cmr4